MVSFAKNLPKMMAEMLLKAKKYINAKDALAAIKDVEMSRDKGRKEDYRRGQKGSVHTNKSMMGVKGKTRKLLKR